MNYRNIALTEINNFSKEVEEYSLPEILYSGIRLLKLDKLSDLHKVTDEEIYTAFNKARELEKDISKVTDEDILKMLVND